MMSATRPPGLGNAPSNDSRTLNLPQETQLQNESPRRREVHDDSLHFPDVDVAGLNLGLSFV